MAIVRTLLVVAWFIVGWASWRAITGMGASSAGDIFLGDLAHPWRGQFNLDFLSHLLLVALWLGWTAQRRLLAPAIGLAAILGGGLFTFAYLLARSFAGDGTIRHLLLGRHHCSAGVE
jgi:hypothetical protein